MHLEEHFLIGWHISQFSGLDRRERIAISMCSIIPDIDALPRLAGQQWYNYAHHTFGHCILFGLLIMAAAFYWGGENKHRFSLFCGLSFIAHLGADLIGTRWALYLYWPFASTPVMSSYGWWLGAWQNRAVLLGLLLLAIPSMLYFRHSPLEMLNSKLDRMATAYFVKDLRPGQKCSCNNDALCLCEECKTPICLHCNALGPGFIPLCKKCNVDEL